MRCGDCCPHGGWGKFQKKKKNQCVLKFGEKYCTKALGKSIAPRAKIYTLAKTPTRPRFHFAVASIGNGKRALSLTGMTKATAVITLFFPFAVEAWSIFGVQTWYIPVMMPKKIVKYFFNFQEVWEKSTYYTVMLYWRAAVYRSRRISHGHGKSIGWSRKKWSLQGNAQNVDMSKCR